MRSSWAGKPFGRRDYASPPLAQRYLELGCLFTAVGADIQILARGAEQLAQRFKQRS